MTVRTKILLGLAAVGLCASALVPAAAQAQTAPGHVAIQFSTLIWCNDANPNNNPPIKAVFPLRGNLSQVARGGWCEVDNFAGLTHDQVAFYDGDRLLGTFVFNDGAKTHIMCVAKPPPGHPSCWLG